MGVVEDLADALAVDSLKAAQETGDDLLVDKVSEILGADSVTTQEAFLTAIRVRKADRRARAYLDKRMAKDPAG